MQARCQCGQLTVDLPDAAPTVIACHCSYCQRRSGSPFGVMAYYPANLPVVHGIATRFARPSDAGDTFETFFCPECGSTVYAKARRLPTLLGVAWGAIGAAGLPPPVLSFWEQHRPDWAEIIGDVEHFRQGR